MRLRWLPRTWCDVLDQIEDTHRKVAAIHGQAETIHGLLVQQGRALRTLIDKEAHEAEVLAAIQDALSGVDLPPGKLEAINQQVQANIAKLRAVPGMPSTTK